MSPFPADMVRAITTATPPFGSPFNQDNLSFASAKLKDLVARIYNFAPQATELAKLFLLFNTKQITPFLGDFESWAENDELLAKQLSEITTGSKFTR